MSTAALTAAAPQSAGRRAWGMVALAALAMVGTLPGRTQGLGLITEPLLADLAISREAYAQLNLWATLLGAPLSLVAGGLIVRFGVRAVMTAALLALGAVVLLMAGAQGFAVLFVLIALTRGLGQSALSVASITLVGRWFVQRLPLAMAVFVAALSIGFMLAFPAVGAWVLGAGWRAAWAGVGLILIGVLAPLSLLARNAPEEIGRVPIGVTRPGPVSGDTLAEALGTPAFWVFGIGAALYGLAASGIGLFNQSILEQLGFAPEIYHRSLAVTALSALFGNALGGWWVRKGSLGVLMAAAMLLLAAALAALPSLRSTLQVYLDAAAMGLVGGFVMVVFFTFWPRAYGRAQLGAIQGVAQGLTVLASALGPLLLARCVTLTGRYDLAFYLLAAAVALLAGCAIIVRVPHHTTAQSPDS